MVVSDGGGAGIAAFLSGIMTERHIVNKSPTRRLMSLTDIDNKLIVTERGNGVYMHNSVHHHYCSILHCRRNVTDARILYNVICVF